jgi:hypothetical protein
VAVLLILIALLLVAVSVPVFIHYRGVWREIKCMTSLDTARRQMVDQFLFSAGEVEKEEVKAHVGYVMNGWDDLCPGGGTVYIVTDDDPDAEMPYKLVCGIHGEDKKQLTRLNANYVFKAVCESVENSRAKGESVPESVTVRLNGEDLTARLVSEDQKVKRSAYLSDYDDDVVAFYGVEGVGSFTDTGCADGEVCYFAYADEEHYANWTKKNVWSGDCWILVEHSGAVLPG